MATTTRTFSLNRTEAARRLGVHPETLRRWATSNKIDSRRSMSGKLWFDPEEIEQLRSRVHGVVETVRR